MTSRPIPANSRIRTFSFWAAVVVVLLAGATVTTAIIAKVEHDAVANDERLIQNIWRPARTAEADLLTAYVNQETGQRGYLLTGNATFLQPYYMGRASAVQLQQSLAQLIRSDPASTVLLQKVIDAGTRWRIQSAEPEIAARRNGPIPDAQLVALTTRGKQLFDVLRSTFDPLIGRTEVLISNALSSLSSSQHDGSVATNAALTGAVAIAVLGLVLLQGLLVRPLRRFLRQVQVVASGDYSAPIEAHGPQELNIVAHAVDSMRDSIIRATADSAAVQQRLSLREERDRLAADLHDRTIQRVFGLGLALDSMNTTPKRNGPVDLEPLVQETDKIIRELRSVILAISADANADGLRAGIVQLVTDSRHSLGFLPVLEVRGPIDTAVPEHIAAEMLSVLRELLSNVARHARATQVTVSVTYEDEALQLEVADDGSGIALDAPTGQGTHNLRERAKRLDGSTTVGPGPDGGTAIRWRVPVPAD